MSSLDIPLAHPNFVSVYLTGTHNDVSYQVMELVDGSNLATPLDQGPLTSQDALAIASALCQALHAAHLAGITHGNLKPTNVFISNRTLVKVSDFAGAWRSSTPWPYSR